MPPPENRALTDKFMLRLPDGMRERIRREAKANGRSMNQEIVHALEGYFPAGPTPELLARNIRLFLDWAQNGRDGCTELYKERGRENLLQALARFMELVETENSPTRDD